MLLILKIMKMNNKSFALILVLFIMLAFSALGLTAINIASRMDYYFINQINYLKAYYAAEAVKNYYLEDISFANNLTDGTFNVAAFSENLGTATCAIVYESRNARAADIRFRGFIQASQFDKPLRIEENSQAIAGSTVVPSPTIVDQIKRYNVIVWGAYDHLGAATSPMRINRDCLNCYNCGGGYCSEGSPPATYAPGQKFYANAYFNLPLVLTGTWYYGGCSTTMVSWNKAAWGTSAAPKNLTVNGSLNNSQITTPPTYYGVFGTLFNNGSLTGTTDSLHGNPQWVNCTGNPNPNCLNWPTTKPTLNLAYYDAILTKASSSTLATLTMNATHALRQLSGRNIFVNGNVTISTTSAAPLTGPGNIITTGSITISDNTYIGDNIGLIAQQNITIGQGCRIGGTYNANGFIYGAGTLIYSRLGIMNVGKNTVMKSFCVLKDASDTNTPNTAATMYFNREPTTGDCYTFAYTKIQGLVYTEALTNHMGYIYGTLLAEKIPSDPGRAWCGSSCSAWWTTGMGVGNVYDNYQGANPAIGDDTTNFQLPLKIRGLYNLLVLPN